MAAPEGRGPERRAEKGAGDKSCGIFRPWQRFSQSLQSFQVGEGYGGIHLSE